MEGVVMTDSEILKTMARYNQWANRELFAAVRGLPEGEVAKQRRSLFKTILNTLNHPLVADRVWWAVCTENLNPNVLTMKSAQYGARIYDAGSLNLARDRRILVQ